MTARAIPAAFNGQKFRSRLEARWAIVLTLIGFPFEYEPQMFDLPGGKYLPDFRIFSDYDIRFWIEIKGPVPDAREFRVATEVNLYEDPLVIFSGDIPMKPTGGTAWFFDPEQANWFMISPQEALIRLACRNQDVRPDTLGPAYEDALSAARSVKFSRLPQKAKAS